MRRLLVNDQLSALPDHRTFWHDLMEWFDMEFAGADFGGLVKEADERIDFFLQDGYAGDDIPRLIIRNATWFGPLKASATVPTISLLQDIITEGPQRHMQLAVIASSKATVFNSIFTADKYIPHPEDESTTLDMPHRVIPLPVDFTLFEPGNAMGLQQSLSLPDGCVCWIGASVGAAGAVKGWDIFVRIARLNPDIPFVGVFKDAAPEYGPPNLRTFVRATHEELVKVIGACRVGLCTSRMESQHLAGIEMGACGLPMVAPPVGCYWKREDMPGILVGEPTPESYATALRAMLKQPGDPQAIREYWQREYDKPVIRAAWTTLIEEVECSGR
jgi:glycosyltransferase involved in cell wall biosynthesis